MLKRNATSNVHSHFYNKNIPTETEHESRERKEKAVILECTRTVKITFSLSNTQLTY